MVLVVVVTGEICIKKRNKKLFLKVELDLSMNYGNKRANVVVFHSWCSLAGLGREGRRGAGKRGGAAGGGTECTELPPFEILLSATGNII